MQYHVALIAVAPFLYTMCTYAYGVHRCGHDYYLLDDTIEYCDKRTLSAYSVEAWTADMCFEQIVRFTEISDEECDECDDLNEVED